MKRRAIAVALAIALVPLLAAAQHARPGPRQAHHPDLQGVWDNSTLTPLERPAGLADQEFFSAAAAADYETLEQYIVRLQARSGDAARFVSGETNGIWRGARTVGPDRRTSIIVDPPNGRLPALTPYAAARAAALARTRREHPADDPEQMLPQDRCLLWGADPPMLPQADNNNLQIVQTPDYVVILNEMIHDARIIPMDGRPHLPRGIARWTGDSRGRWEGDTLIVDTTNFTDKTQFAGSGPNLHVVERFTRTAANTLRYDFTVDDRDSFDRPVSGRLWMTKTDDRIFEYACHEGNYSLIGIMRGARAGQ